jgi:hypothetical protein
MTAFTDIERCRREIAAIEAELLTGNPDVQGLCLPLSDWSAELRIIEAEQRREKPPGLNPAAEREADWFGSVFDRVGTLAVLRLGRGDLQAHLLADGAGKEPADAVGLPVGCFHQTLKRGALRPFQQIEDFSRLATVAGGTGLFSGLGRFLRGAGILGRLSLLRPNVRALWGNTGFLLAFGDSPAVVAAVPFSSVINVVIW